MAPPLVALTGATGFLGGYVAQALAAQGWRLRLLVRGELADVLLRALQPEVVIGDLSDTAALRSVCHGAQAVIHVAGLVKARRPSLFQQVNAEGTRRLADVAHAACPNSPFVLVSSLAARWPQLSAYARSKRDGELAVGEVMGGAAWIVRPPAIYGPGDRASLGLFRAALASPALPVLSREFRVPLIHVQDAARAVAALAVSPARPSTVALCDGHLDGYSLREIMTQAAEAVGRAPRLATIPAAAVRAVGLAGDLAGLLGATSMVTSGKVRELLQGDWSLSERDLAQDGPAPRFGLQAGFRDTVAGYRAMGWLA